MPTISDLDKPSGTAKLYSADRNNTATQNWLLRVIYLPTEPDVGKTQVGACTAVLGAVFRLIDSRHYWLKLDRLTSEAK
jgi:hypothetical protein